MHGRRRAGQSTTLRWLDDASGTAEADGSLHLALHADGKLWYATNVSGEWQHTVVGNAMMTRGGLISDVALTVRPDGTADIVHWSAEQTPSQSRRRAGFCGAPALSVGSPSSSRTSNLHAYCS